MSKRIGSVYLELDKGMTTKSFKGLQGIVNGVVNNLKPVTLKLDVKNTTKEFNELSKVLKDVASNINKINTSKIAGGSGVAKEINEATEAFNRMRKLQAEMSSLAKDLNKADPSSGAAKTMSRQLEELSAKYAQMKSMFSDMFTPKQKNTLSDEWEKLSRSIELVQSKMADKRSAQEAASAQRAAAEAAKQAAQDQAQADKEAAQAARDQAKAQKEAEQIEKQRANSLKNLYNMLRQIRQLETSVKNGKGGEGSQSYQDLLMLDNAVSDAIARGGATSEEMNEFRTNLSATRLEIDGTGDAIRNMTSPLDALESRLVYMVSLSNLVMQAVRQFKEMFNTVVELDSAMTQLRIVTNNTEAEYATFGKNTSQVAQEIGASTKDLIDSTTTFARLGYSLSESSDLARLTAMLSKVGDVDVSSAQNAMTAITKAFKDVDTSNIESAMDKMVTVGNNFPISVAELAEGMNNAGSALAASGNSFDQSVALLTAANTTIQNISKSSTGLRTITARIRKTKVELDDLGETITEASYQNVLDLLTGKGVSLTDENGFRSTYDILKDIAAIWDELDTKSQAAVAEQLAGNRQQNVFFSIIEQFGEAEKAMTAMQNSQGAMASAYDERMESIEAHMDTFKAAYEELANSFIDKDISKGVIDFGTALLNILTAVSDAMGGMKSVAPIVTGALATFISAFSKSKMFGNLMNASGISSIAKSFKDLGAVIAGIGKSGFSLSSLLGIFSTPAGIGVVVAGITAAVYALSKLQAKVQEQTYAGRTKHVGELSDQLAQDYGEGSRYDELIHKTRLLTEAERQELIMLEAQKTAREENLRLAKEQQFAAFQREQGKDSQIYDYEKGSHNFLEWFFATKPEDRYNVTSGDVKTFENIQNAVADLDAQYEEHKLHMDEYAKSLDLVIDGNSEYYKVLKEHQNDESLSQSQRDFIKFYEDLLDRQNELKKTLENDPLAVAKRNLEDYVLARQAKGDTIFDIRQQEEYIRLQEEYANAMKSAGDATDEAGNKIKTAAETAKESLSELWDSEDFAETRVELEEIARTTGSISANKIEELANKGGVLAGIMDETGMSARFLANVLSHEVLNGDGFDLITDKALRVDAAMQAIIDRTAGAKAAIDEFNAATASDNADAASSYAQAYQKFFADWDAGRTGSTAVQAAVNTFFSPDQLEQMGWDLQAAGEQLSSDFFQAIFSTEGDPGANFASYVRDHYTEAWQDAVEITENADGTFDIAVTSAQALADAMGTDINVANAFIEAMGAWGTHLFATGEELENLATELGLVGSNASNVESVVNAINSLALDGLDGTQIKATLDALSDAGYIDTSGIEDLDGKITAAVENYNALDQAAPDVEVTTNLDEVDAAIANTQSKIDSLHGKHIVNTVETRHVGGNIEDTQASGTKNAPGGRTLVNELGPELISQNGHAFIANGGKPAVVNLDKGAVVLNASDTRSALRGGSVSGVIGAMASGSRATFPTNYNPGGYGGGGGGGSSGKSSGSSSSSNSSSANKEKTWFEQQYDYHKHLVEMDQELQSDFLDWLDEAYKKAYAEGIIDLEEYMQHEEEVYKGRQDQFKDYLSDLDYSIDMAKKAGASSEDVANMYQRMLDEINHALEIAFARGLDENDDYVQYLQNQWYTYYDNLKDAREDAQDDAMDAVDDLVQYRIKMLKQYIKNEVDALKERLSNLKDFYSKQKDMLKDVADTEDYLDEQAEKRKSVSDIESQLSMLELDNSAWAQKRKAKLKEELADAQKELSKFERDHAIDVASDQLDAAYEVQERAINARIDQLNDLADNPKALYDQALKDVQNNSIELYEEMIEFNNKYGDGIQKTIVDMWEQAYISLKNYAELYHEFYNGVDLVNATNYQPGTAGNVGGNVIARNPGGSAVKVVGTLPEEISTAGTPGYSDIDPAVQAQIEAAQAAMQAQLDAVMNNIQAATSGLLDQVAANTQATLSNLTNSYALGGVNMGDIIIQGNATQDTISEIRRAQRDNISNMLRALNTLNNK